MGPLSFSFPGRVRGFLEEAGIGEDIAFRRSGFELRTPDLDMMMSQPLTELESELAGIFPGERDGLARFLRQLGSAISASRDMDLWHPDFAVPRGANSGATRRRSDRSGQDRRGSPPLAPSRRPGPRRPDR